MTKIDLSFQVLMLDGSLPTTRLSTGETIPSLPESYGQIVAEHVLARASKGPAMKFMTWARKLHANESLELDSTDFDLFQKTITDSEILANFVKGPILEILLAAKKSE